MKDNRIHLIDESGNDNVFDVGSRVERFTIYDGKIYYKGYNNNSENIVSFCQLYCIDIVTKEKNLLVNNQVDTYDIFNGNIYYTLSPDNYLRTIEVSGTDDKILINEPVGSYQIVEDGILYFTDQNTRLNKYAFKTEKSERILECQTGSWSFCGNYICKDDYWGDGLAFIDINTGKVEKYESRPSDS